MIPLRRVRCVRLAFRVNLTNPSRPAYDGDQAALILSQPDPSPCARMFCGVKSAAPSRTVVMEAARRVRAATITGTPSVRRSGAESAATSRRAAVTADLAHFDLPRPAPSVAGVSRGCRARSSFALRTRASRARSLSSSGRSPSRRSRWRPGSGASRRRAGDRVRGKAFGPLAAAGPLLRRHCDGAAQAGVRTKAVAPSRGGARSDLDDRESTQCVAGRREVRGQQAPSRALVGVGTAPGFMPNRNSALIGKGAERLTTRRVSRLANLKSERILAKRPLAARKRGSGSSRRTRRLVHAAEGKRLF